MNALVGYTGFVGSNLYSEGSFDAVYHSENIEEAFGTKPDLLVYSGLRAEKYLANQAPERDMELILQAEENISRISPKKLVLISTVDVFKAPDGVQESTGIQTEGLHPYGYNRYQLEVWVRERYADALIVRLPGLFGKNIKKNFIYDYMHVIPFMLKQEKMQQLLGDDPQLEEYYQIQENGFYKVRDLDRQQEACLKEKFQKLGFSALHFTDSRSIYQFYPLKRLWKDIQTAMQQDVRLWHPATEPVSAGELYQYLTGERFVNELPGVPAKYDYWTEYAELFGGQGHYIMSKEEVMAAVKDFVSCA